MITFGDEEMASGRHVHVRAVHGDRDFARNDVDDLGKHDDFDE